MDNNHKTKMLKSVERMMKIADRWYGDNLRRELEQLHEALESDDNDAISEAISETVDGCGTAVSELRDLNWALDEFEQAQHDYQQSIQNAIDEFENE